MKGSGRRAGARWAGVAACATALALPAAAGAFGEPDPSFGTGGFTILDDPTGPEEFIGDVLVLADDKVLGAGGADGGANGFLLARLNANGTPDATFGGDGITVQPNSGPLAPRNLNEIEADAQGRIVGAGLGNGTSADTIAFARYTAQGLPDASFGGDGLSIFDCPANVSCEGFDVTPTPDGGIAAAGKYAVITGPGAGDDGGVFKVGANGAPADGFSGDGIASFEEPGAPTSTRANAIEALANGSLIVGGAADDEAMLTRLTSTGAVDGSFGTAGFTVEDLGGNPASGDEIYDVEVLPGGQIIVAGQVGGGTGQAVVARFTAGGTLDASFGDGGVHLRTSAGPSAASAVAVDGQGRIVVAGFVGAPDSESAWAARLTPEGDLDPTFGTAGETIADLGSTTSVAYGLTLGPGDAAVLGGQTLTPSDGRLLFGRLVGDPVGECRGAEATIVAPDAGGETAGTPDDDVIAGGAGPDVIRAGAGNDVVCGLDANDRAFGEGGDDTLDGAAGKDNLKGGPGKDKLKGGAGKDRLSGGGGKDKLSGGAARDKLSGGGGKDRCSGGPGKDTERGC